MKRIKVITSHVGISRYIAELSEEPVGYVVNPAHIPSPYSYSPTRSVWLTRDGLKVIVMETDHKRYEIYQVEGELAYSTEAKAEEAFLAPRKGEER